ncbi:Non-specific serine/threonine protein kinase [Sulfidibacter corallicola]|uniref:Serine/threonine protein kinase n=1 Tax=Sulfidibacter corallicola TaxID=2818388 RepID=A0A8A4TGC2_SULCO|nr:serine/threonine-protein kinase [Sulfidibacter corallicola]QTD48254.1 serine/threonine protein kinase [Sulfidibacter corallicola]
MHLDDFIKKGVSASDRASLAAEFLEEMCHCRPDLVKKWLSEYSNQKDSDLSFEGHRNSGENFQKSEGLLQPGSRCGPFLIERRLGRGGMGTVYLASRADELDLKVALKTLHTWNPKAISMFKRECKILSGLKHSFIAHLIDAGTLPSGQPWLAMEFVEGQTLNVYLARENLDLKARLKLFLKICEGLGHAHQQMVIHRDLKPHNIMITAEGTPKLLDFGIAALLNPETGLQITLTSNAAPLMTPEYASPEQVNGQRLSAASDVYSLGVLLYEMLAGQRPYRMNPRILARVVQVVNSAPIIPPSRIRPEKKSTRNSLSKHLRGDIDTIVMKALERDLIRRYATVEALAGDLRAYLRGLPIEARPATRLYRFRKFLTRNPWPVGFSFFFCLFLAFLAFFATYKQTQITLEKQTAEKVTDFLVSLFEQTTPDLNKGRDVSAFEIMENGRRQLDSQLLDEPDLRIRLSGTLGRVYRSLGHYDISRQLFQRGVESTKPGSVQAFMAQLELIETLELDGDLYDANRRLASLTEYWSTVKDPVIATRLARAQGRSLNWAGKYSESLEVFNKALPFLKSLPLSEQLEFRQDRAEVYIVMNAFQDAVSELESILHAQERIYGKIHSKTAYTLLNLSVQCWLMSQIDRSEVYNRRAGDILDELFEPNHPLYILYWRNRGNIEQNRGDWKQSEGTLLKALALAGENLGKEHPLRLNILSDLTLNYRRTMDYDKAESTVREALMLKQKLYGDDHTDVASLCQELAKLLLIQGKYDSAEKLFFKSLEIDSKLLGHHSRWTAYHIGAIGDLFVRKGDFSSAELYFEKYLELIQTLHREKDKNAGIPLHNLAVLKRKQRRYKEAELFAYRAHAGMIDQFGRDHPHAASASISSGLIFLEQGRFSEAEPFICSALDLLERKMGNRHILVSEFTLYWVEYCLAIGAYLEAEAIFADISLQILGYYKANHLKIAEIMAVGGDVFFKTGDLIRSKDCYEYALGLYQEVFSENRLQIVQLQIKLSKVFLEMDLLEEATSVMDLAKEEAIIAQDPLVYLDL